MENIQLADVLLFKRQKDAVAAINQEPRGERKSFGKSSVKTSRTHRPPNLKQALQSRFS